MCGRKGGDLVTDQSIDHSKLAELKAELGVNFARILSYYREDGERTIAAIRDAFTARSAVALVRPAHTLKGESLQFGAIELAMAAERIEKAARDAVEDHKFCLSIETDVVRLPDLFSDALAVLCRDDNPSPMRKAIGFGRKVGFGRAGV